MFKSKFNINSLYIHKFLPEILDKLENNKIIIIQSPTGTGKSLGIPKSFIEKYNKSTTSMSNTKRIFISVPTIAAVFNLYETQKLLSPNIEVGYAAEGDIKYNINSKIVYCTTGHLRKVMLSYKDKQIDFCDVLMIDEAHTGTVDNSIVLSLYKDFIKNNQIGNNKLIISSATLENIDSLILNNEVEKIIINIHFRKIVEEYHDKDYKCDDLQLYLDTVKVINDYHQTQEEGNHFLVFAAGRNEILKIIDNLRLDDAEILELTGQMDNDLLKKVFAPCPIDKKRKIIIATNAAESSITIENIGLIIDTMTEKVAGSTQNGSISLTTSHISKCSATQRKGRTGRTIDGICYRMCTKIFYESLQSNKKNDIERVPLHTYILELLKHGFNPKDILYELKDTNKVNETMILINKLKLYNEETKLVTEMGDFIADFPLSVRSGVMLYKTILRNKIDKSINIYPVLLAICLMDCFGPSYFYIPKMDKDNMTVLIEDYIEEHFSQYQGDSDLETNLNWYKTLIEDSQGYIDQKVVKAWCLKNSFNNKKVSELLKRIDKVYEILTKRNIIVYVCDFNPNELVTQLMDDLKEAYFDRIMIKTGKGYTDDCDLKYLLNKRISYTFDNSYDKTIGINCNSIHNSKCNVRFVNFHIPFNEKKKVIIEDFSLPETELFFKIPNLHPFLLKKKIISGNDY